jgi:hypothetical protein
MRQVLAATLALPLVLTGANTVQAQQPSRPTSDNASPGTSGEKQKGDQLKAGEMGGGSGNTGQPGDSPASSGNATQDTRTTKTRDR